MKRPYTPPIPADRLQAMWLAVARHIIAIDDAVESEDGGEFLDRAMAVEIEQMIELLMRGPQRSPRYDLQDLRATAIARHMIESFGIPQEQAVKAVFANPNEVDVESLCRKYRNLVKKLPRYPVTPASLGRSSDLANEMLVAYARTEHYKKRKAKKGKLKRES